MDNAHTPGPRAVSKPSGNYIDAPDLLAVLIEAQEAIDVLADDAADAGYHARAESAADLAMRLRAAIAKATGGI